MPVAAQRERAEPPVACVPAWRNGCSGRGAGDSHAGGKCHRADAARPALLPLQGAHRVPGELPMYMKAGLERAVPRGGEEESCSPAQGLRCPAVRSICTGGASGRPGLVNPRGTAAIHSSRGGCPADAAKPGVGTPRALRHAAQGMSLVPAVTELLLAEFMYLQYDDVQRPIHLYINSTGVAVRNADPTRLSRVWDRLIRLSYTSCFLPSLHLIRQCLQAGGLMCSPEGPAERGGQAGLRGRGFRDLRHHAVREAASVHRVCGERLRRGRHAAGRR